MSAEQNKAIIHRALQEVFSQGILAVVDELFDESYIAHNAPPGIPTGPEGVKLLVTAYRNAFPDLRFTLETIIAEEDKVVQRWTMEGTHQGDLMGIPPTGRQVSVTGIEIDRIASGKIVENWLNFDQLALLQQLGAIPVPGQGS
jgi:steroid delta-isomerase-like uncharacterized protein